MDMFPNYHIEHVITSSEILAEVQSSSFEGIVFKLRIVWEINHIFVWHGSCLYTGKN
jgi:hypothetical protein